MGTDYIATIQAINGKLIELQHEAIASLREYQQLKAVVDTGDLGVDSLVATAGQKTAAQARMTEIEARVGAACAQLNVAPVEEGNGSD